MNHARTNLADPADSLLAGLRREFDEAFAAAPAPRVAHRPMLAIRVAGEAFAVDLGQVQGLHADREVVAVPSPLPQLLGLASFGARSVPVFDLAGLIGQATPRRVPRWLLLAGGQRAVALAFDDFEGKWEVPLEVPLEGSTDGALDERAGVARGTVRHGQEERIVIDVEQLASQIAAKAGALAARIRTKGAGT